MNRQKPIFTEKNNCLDCYKCVRQCPVKAIKLENHNASIVPELCIYCGHCTLVCPAKAKIIRDDVDWARRFLASGVKVVASIAPSFVGEFDCSPMQLVEGLHRLGFAHVSETALGAQWVSAATGDYLASKTTGVYLSSACPSVVSLVEKYYPEHLEKLVPVDSPMQAHGKFLHQHYKEPLRVVFFGPCIAKKCETDQDAQWVDVALTFRDLAHWFEEAGIELAKLPDSSRGFEPFAAAEGALYPVDGGMIRGITAQAGVIDAQFMAFSGFDSTDEILRDLHKIPEGKPMFLELLTCRGGCVKGPGTFNQNAGLIKRQQVINHAQQTACVSESVTTGNLTRKFDALAATSSQAYSMKELREALEQVGKLSEKDDLNCGACGYDTCLRFGAAMLDEKAQKYMCVSYMRQIASGKAAVLLHKIPSGVVIVDDKLKIVESNISFAKLLGSEMEKVFEFNPGLEGADITKLVNYHKIFSTLLFTGEEVIVRDIQDDGKYLHISVFTIQKHKIVCGIIQDLREPQMQKHFIQERARELMRRNLETVQTIAQLLGETAAYTDSMLNSIAEPLNVKGERNHIEFEL